MKFMQKKFSLGILLIMLVGGMLPERTFAMTQPMFGALSVAGNTTATRYMSFGSGADSGVHSSDANARHPIAIGGTVGNLHVRVTVAPGAGASWTVTLMKNAIAQSIECSISDAATTCTDTVDTVSVSAGDTLSWRVVPSAGTPPLAADFFISSSFTGSTAGEAIIGGGNQAFPVTGTTYYTIYGGAATTSQAHASTTMPTNGTVDQMYVVYNGSPGTGDSYTLTLYKNGSATGLSCQVSEAQTSCTDLVDSVSYSAGDSIYMQLVVGNSPTSRVGNWGFRFRPTIDGESPLFGRLTSFSNVTRYHLIHGAASRLQNEIDAQVDVPVAMTVRKLYLDWNYGQPTTGTTRTFTLRKNGADTALAVVSTDSPKRFTDLADSVSYVAGDDINMKVDVTGAPPTSPSAFYSMVAYIDPGTTNTSTYRYYSIGKMLLNNGRLILR